jgi:hypothetical protein
MSTSVEQIDGSHVLLVECREVYFDGVSLSDRVHNIESQLADHLRAYGVDARNLAERIAGLEGVAKAPLKPTSPILIAVLGVLLAGFATYLYWLGSKTIQNGENIATVLAQVNQIVTTGKLKAAAGLDGSSAADLRAIPDIVQRAIAANTRVESGLVASVGLKILNNVKYLSTLDGQRALSAVLNYKSFLASSAAPDTSGAKPITDLVNSNIEVAIHNPKGVEVGAKQAPQVEHVGIAPESEGAIMQSLSGQFGHPPNRPLSPRFYVVTSRPGWGLQLDGMRYKNVIFKNSEIFYDGGPVELINVYFINCRFTKNDSPPWSEFAKTLLVSSPVRFESPSRG